MLSSSVSRVPAASHSIPLVSHSAFSISVTIVVAEPTLQKTAEARDTINTTKTRGQLLPLYRYQENHSRRQPPRESANGTSIGEGGPWGNQKRAGYRCDTYCGAAAFVIYPIQATWYNKNVYSGSRKTLYPCYSGGRKRCIQQGNGRRRRHQMRAGLLDVRHLVLIPSYRSAHT